MPKLTTLLLIVGLYLLLKPSTSSPPALPTDIPVREPNGDLAK